MLNPFAKYIDCINCGNELSDLSSLTFRTPDKIQCDFCGQEYPGLRSKIIKTKTMVNFIFTLVAVFIWALTMSIAGFTSALFAIMALLVAYYFALGAAIKRTIRF